MAPSKASTAIKNDTTHYGWCLAKKEDEININDLQHTYRVNLPICSHGCKRTCKRNPRCLWGFGEKKWIKSNEESHSDEEDEQLNRNEGQLAGIANLGATCYVNSLLQIWFHNPILRPALLKWKPNNAYQPCENISDASETQESYKPACPISHLQAMFARMLLSKRSTIDPTQFTTSLSLNTGEQQDAQEFSNLLMTLLDGLLEKYQSKEIQTLIKDSFTGSYAHEITCKTCKNSSVSHEDFKELSLTVMKTLKESIKDFLKVEIMANANQYSCGMCGMNRDAERKIKNLKLPPVLNIHLIRFIYDRDSQQRKKTKTQITFPEMLDMSEFVQNESGDASDNIYMLNAVLNHKGRAAHHGHYIAHIKDLSTGNWFECNDDSVQRVKSSSKTLVIKNDEANNNATPGAGSSKTTEYTSDAAYMLVYTRKSYMNSSNNIEIHDYLKNLVAEEDKVYEEEYLRNKITRDNETRRKDQRQDDINFLYRDLLPKVTSENVKPDNNGVNNGNTSSPKVKSTPVPPAAATHQTDFDFVSNHFLSTLFDIKLEPRLENKTITCRHGKLKPPSPNDIGISYRIIPQHFSEVVFARYEFDVRLQGNAALCLECVQANCKIVKGLATLEEDYKRFQDLTNISNNQDENEPSVWVSNELMRSWRKHAKRETELGGLEHIPTDDLEGEETLINSELQCDHGELSPSVPRTSINISAWSIINKYFPTALTWETTRPPCADCIRISELNSRVQQDNKVLASNYKTSLPDLYSNKNRPDISAASTTGVFYLIPTTFVQEWKKFIRDPAKTSTPILQNEELLCHCSNESLMYPIHAIDELIGTGVLEESLITIITEGEWTYLKEQLGIKTELQITVNAGTVVYANDPCPACSVEWWIAQKQKTYQYKYGNIFIEKKDDVDELSQEPQYAPDGEEDIPQSNGKREKKEPIRRSKRTRLAKNVKKYTNIESSMTMKDFQKLHLYKDYSAILSDQHIYLFGKELTEEDKCRTFRELEIASNSTLVLVVDPPSLESDIIEIDVDTSKPSQPENGFRGTILHGGA